jgi:hypothetical protein
LRVSPDQRTPSRCSRYLVDPGIAAAWRVSGEPMRAGHPSPANPDTPDVANIGVAFDLMQWAERAPKTMFITAVGPSNPLFAAYVPHHGNVFSLLDVLEDVDSEKLSYYVVGWYSDPDQDIAGQWQRSGGSFPDFLTSQRWSVKADGTATRSVYVGGVFDIAWQRDGQPPQPDPLQDIRESGHLNVAVGNTEIDAFTSMISQQITDPGAATLLRAFNYDLLPVLNQVNGDALLQERIRQQWFGNGDGGRRWIITDVKSSSGAAVAALSDPEAALLRTLNRTQVALDDALAELFGLQWTVNALWYKRGWLNSSDDPPSGAPTPQALGEALDPAQPGSVAARLLAQLQIVGTLLALVPAPDWTSATTRDEAFQNGIAAFAAAKGLDRGKQLKAVAMPRYWHPNNPITLIAGVKSPYERDPDGALTVRFIHQVITSFTAGGKPIGRDTAGRAMRLPASAALPDFVAPLLDELFLLDPANADCLAQAVGLQPSTVAAVMTQHSPADYGPNLPALGLAPWTQPWAPLFMEWRGKFYAIDAKYWTFDGSDYRYSGGAAPTATTVGGISLLSPHTQFVFASRLKDFLDKYAASQPELEKLYDEISKIFQWEFLTQSLTGFNDRLTRRDTRAFRRPVPTETIGATPNQHRLADLIGYDDPEPGPDALPDALRGHVTSVPFVSGTAPFQGIRQGQFCFSDLILYDRFGRTLDLIVSGAGSGLYNPNNFPVVIDPAFSVGSKVPDLEQVQSVLELPPRLLQPGRLDIQLLDQADDDKLLSLNPEAMPVCAWLLPNHLNGSLLLYAPNGASLGEMRLVVGLDGSSKTAEWVATPQCLVSSLQQLETVSRHLHAFVAAPAFGREENFNAFLASIDATLWTIDPLGNRADQNLSVLIGRPLALVRARLQLQTDGTPARDPGFAATFDTAPPSWLSQPFAIRLGDQATRQDGTIGYFSGPGTATSYDQFNSVVAAEVSEQSYVHQIGPLGEGQNYLRLTFASRDYAYVTLLMDPRASVHATTGLFPVKQLDLPPQFVDRPLAAMEVCFRMGPILTSFQSSPGTGNAAQNAPSFPQSIACSMPAEQNGRWAWWELGADATTWSGYELTDSSNNAKLLSTPATLREGTFQLTIDFKKTS